MRERSIVGMYSTRDKAKKFVIFPADCSELRYGSDYRKQSSIGPARGIPYSFQTTHHKEKLDEFR